MLEPIFNKVEGLTPILKSIFQRLLLHCTCTTHCYHGVIRFAFTFFLMITTATVKISHVCFWFKLKRLLRIRSSHQSCFIIKGVLKAGLYDEIFLSRWLNFSFDSFLSTFNTCILLRNVNEIFQSTIMKVFQKKKFLPGF